MSGGRGTFCNPLRFHYAAQFILAAWKLGGHTMNWDRIQGDWKTYKGKMKEEWGKLTDDDMKVIEGRGETLIGRVQERYGLAKEEATKKVQDWADRCGCG